MPRTRKNDNSNVECEEIDDTGHVNNNLLERFTGRDNSVKISSWLKLFEAMTTGYNNKKRIQLLVRHLGGDALNWFAEEQSGNIDTMSWAQCKDKLIERFGEPMIRPIIMAQKRFLLRSETVQAYYTEKMSLLRQVGLCDQDMTALLTEGMPRHYQVALISAQVKSPAAWLAVALQLEETNKKWQQNVKTRPPASVNFTTKSPSQQKQYGQTGQSIRNQNNNRKPPRPCKYCSQQGLIEWHWHNECPRRTTIKQLETPLSTVPISTDSPTLNDDSSLAINHLNV